MCVLFVDAMPARPTTTYGAYHTSLAVAPLATGQATDFVQGGSSGPQVPERACTSLLG